MQTNFNLGYFISTFVTKRPQSLLGDDFLKYKNELNHRINGKKVLVIGGAGTIGSSYIKAILKFHIAKLVVVDINENGLTELVRDSIMNFPALYIRDAHEPPEAMEEASVMMVGLDKERILQGLVLLENQKRGSERTLRLVADYSMPQTRH
jgi:glutamyl-tRNA reductase